MGKTRTIAQRVVELREQRGMTQAELARLAGLGQGHVSRLEAGKIVAPNSDVVVALARALSCTTDAILIG